MEPPAPVEEKIAPVSTPAPTPSAHKAVSDTGFWKSLLAGLSGKISPGEYTFLILPSTVGEYSDGVLTIWTDDPFAHTMVNKPSVLGSIALEAERLAKCKVQVFAKEGRPPVQPQKPLTNAPSHDNLDDLLALGRQFDNINITE